jgi:hypothetical protein
MPDPRAALVMAEIDALPKAWRSLVHKFGWQICAALINDGVTNAQAAYEMLIVWRERRQVELLATDHFVRRDVNREGAGRPYLPARIRRRPRHGRKPVAGAIGRS